MPCTMYAFAVLGHLRAVCLPSIQQKLRHDVLNERRETRRQKPKEGYLDRPHDAENRIHQSASSIPDDSLCAETCKLGLLRRCFATLGVRACSGDDVPVHRPPVAQLFGSCACRQGLTTWPRRLTVQYRRSRHTKEATAALSRLCRSSRGNTAVLTRASIGFQASPASTPGTVAQTNAGILATDWSHSRVYKRVRRSSSELV